MYQKQKLNNFEGCINWYNYHFLMLMHRRRLKIKFVSLNKTVYSLIYYSIQLVILYTEKKKSIKPLYIEELLVQEIFQSK